MAEAVWALAGRGDPGESDPAPISALNHLLFCERRCALIHIDGVYVENRFTVEGRLGHERVDEEGVEATRPCVRVARALPLFSDRLSLSGKADVVEFHALPGGRERPYPIDYKRGKRKAWDNDDVQLCAQALCLEEMLATDVPAGAIFHLGSRRQREVLFGDALRRATLEAIERLHGLLRARRLPLAVLDARCEGCSLRSTCMPEIASRPVAVSRAAGALFLCDDAPGPESTGGNR